jgi:hypothetical protein
VTGDSSVAGIGPRPVGAGSGAVARQGRAAGRGRRWHKRLTGGAGWQWGPRVSAGVLEGVRESEAARQRALTCGPDQYSAGQRDLK